MRFVCSSLSLVLAAASLCAQPALQLKVVPGWFQLPAGWSFGEMAAVAVDARQHVFVVHRGAHPVIEFDEKGMFVRAFGEGLFDRAHSARFDPQGNLWIVDDAAHVVLRFDSQMHVNMVLGRHRKPGSSVPPAKQGPRGARDEDILKFDRPTDVAFSTAGDIYVSDGYGNSRIVKFTKDGEFVRTWGTRGTGPGQFDTPHSVAVDRQGRVYVGDRENYRIQVFDANGEFLRQWTHVGSPWGLYIAPDQSLYMCDGYNNRVLKLSLDGKVLGAYGTMGKLPGQFTYAHNLTVASDGAVYTAEVLNWRPQRFDPVR
ncbi:MAG: peptidyl-alpha-hydroxyglycine alpha-amidating lyase family protein [Acidobacteria bacterium]|nr:peptidyl-alpha-hydroxyglycine alpha-amidating lyase family protein [Acidobacteriota bacterium]